MIRFLATMPLSQRDGLILIVCIGILLLVSQVIWEPWRVDLEAKREKLIDIRHDLAEIESRADELEVLSGDQEDEARFLAQVNMLASQNRIQLESVRLIDSAKVGFRFSSADQVVFWPWLAEMEKKGFRFEQVRLFSVNQAGRLGGQAIVVQASE